MLKSPTFAKSWAFCLKMGFLKIQSLSVISFMVRPKPPRRECVIPVLSQDKDRFIPLGNLIKKQIKRYPAKNTAGKPVF